MTDPQKITFGELGESGVRDVLIYCRDHRCSRSTETERRCPFLAAKRKTYARLELFRF
jgi:hypothetical protein